MRFHPVEVADSHTLHQGNVADDCDTMQDDDQSCKAATMLVFALRGTPPLRRGSLDNGFAHIRNSDLTVNHQNGKSSVYLANLIARLQRIEARYFFAYQNSA